MNPEQVRVFELTLEIEALIEKLEKANAADSPVRSRQLSLAITNIQQGSHWLADYLSEIS